MVCLFHGINFRLYYAFQSPHHDMKTPSVLQGHLWLESTGHPWMALTERQCCGAVDFYIILAWWFPGDNIVMHREIVFFLRTSTHFYTHNHFVKVSYNSGIKNINTSIDFPIDTPVLFRIILLYSPSQKRKLRRMIYKSWKQWPMVNI